MFVVVVDVQYFFFSPSKQEFDEVFFDYWKEYKQNQNRETEKNTNFSEIKTPHVLFRWAQ
jgi:hypothetical protein